jgi:hypothetical protein
MIIIGCVSRRRFFELSAEKNELEAMPSFK